MSSTSPYKGSSGYPYPPTSPERHHYPNPNHQHPYNSPPPPPPNIHQQHQHHPQRHISGPPPPPPPSNHMPPVAPPPLHPHYQTQHGHPAPVMRSPPRDQAREPVAPSSSSSSPYGNGVRSGYYDPVNSRRDNTKNWDYPEYSRQDAGPARHISPPSVRVNEFFYTYCAVLKGR